MNILFISWDSDQTNYLENLFFPIFQGLQQTTTWQFHVMQFSWAAATEVDRIRLLAEASGIRYTQVPVSRRPTPTVGSLRTLSTGSRKIKDYLLSHNIDCLMPRSTLPAWMVLRLTHWLQARALPVVFDADGFPIQERIDFAGLKSGSLHCRWLKQVESRMVRQANRVLTRSEKAIAIHLQRSGEGQGGKFYRVCNGRNPAVFRPNPAIRNVIRQELGISDSTRLWLYSGSIGPQYLVPEMLQLFWSCYQENPLHRFLFLVRNRESLRTSIPEHLKQLVLIETVPFSRVPDYYAAADLGISLRKQAPSLAGLAPIKIGEYLLSGLPVLLSEGIGDLSDLLAREKACFVYRNNTTGFQTWLDQTKTLSTKDIRAVGERYFGLQQSLEDYMHALQHC